MKEEAEDSKEALDTRGLQGAGREGLRRDNRAQGGPEDARAVQMDTKRLEMNGRKVVQLAMRDITPDRLAPYIDIEAFVQTACPRISIDGFTFDRPVLSIPQADALVGLMEGREMGEFLERPKWIELTTGLIPKSR